jgi:hypothetical protein
MLRDSLSRHRAAIVDEWFEQVVAEYPEETARFLRTQQDPFANPVGAGLRDSLGPIFDELLSSVDEERVMPLLDRIIRVRSVQDFKPSQAVGFLLGLKLIIRKRADETGSDCGRELAEIEERIDRLVLAAFDVYTGCREQLCEIRVKEIRNRSLKNMERLNEWRARRRGIGSPDGAESH